MKVTVFYVGSSLLAPLKQAEHEINREHALDLEIAAHNFGAPLADDQWSHINRDLKASDVVFAIHVMDGENAMRLIASLELHKESIKAVIVINCMPDLMRRTRMGRLNAAKVFRETGVDGAPGEGDATNGSKRAMRLFGTAGSWVGRQVRARKSNGKLESRSHTQYLKLIDRLPGILRFVPSAGALRDVKNYLNIFCYFLQPTPANIRSMILQALKEYVPDERLKNATIKTAQPESMPSVAIYHPDAPRLFESFDEYKGWYGGRSPKSKVQSPKSRNQGPKSKVQSPRSPGQSPKSKVQGPKSGFARLDPDNTIGLLLMRPQVVSKTTKHYDALIRAIEAEGLDVIPALSTLMDNREAVQKFFVANKSKVARTNDLENGFDSKKSDIGHWTLDIGLRSRVSQIVSLTGFSFVGGPAMNDSEAAAEFLQQFNRPYRSAVSLDTQTIDAWRASQTGLNPVQAGMQIAIPEIDGATEPFIYGGIPADGTEPIPLDDRCGRYARRLSRWNRLRTAPRREIKLAMVLFCFPPNKGNIGTAADLDVFPSVWDTLCELEAEGYDVEVPPSADSLRELIVTGNSATFASAANVVYRMSVDEYRSLCPYVEEVEKDWGSAPGRVNSYDGELLIQGVQLGNVFIGVQPTFGYEGDPMRLMMARSGSPHHGFMAFYTYLAKVLNVDAAIHVGTHGSMEFMPGKQVGMSDECWPDRLIGDLPNLYIYSVNNPSEGSIAKRRSYAELISYLTPPIENAGLYKDLNSLKDLLMNYRQTADEDEKVRLFETIEESARTSNFISTGPQ